MKAMTTKENRIKHELLHYDLVTHTIYVRLRYFGFGSYNHITNLTWARIAARCVTAVERSLCIDQVSPKPGERKRKRLVSARAVHQMYNYLTLENQTEGLVEKPMSLMIVLNNLFLRLVRDEEVDNSLLYLSRSSPTHPFRVSAHNAMRWCHDQVQITSSYTFYKGSGIPNSMNTMPEGVHQLWWARRP